MTITSTQNRVSYSGNGSTTAFSVPFRFLASADLAVLVRVDATGVETAKTLDTHYSVSGAGAASGGSVTALAGSIPQTGETLIIYGNPAMTQLVDYIAGGVFPAESHEEALDRLTLQGTRSRELVERTPRLMEGDTDGSGQYDANSNRISNLGAPVDLTDAATKTYVASEINNAGLSIPTGLIATGSSTSRSLADRWGEVANVKDFGAVGNGVTNDQPAIQAAIDAASSAGGGEVRIPPGTYLVNDSIVIKEKVHIIGSGRDVSTVKLGVSVDKDVFVSLDSYTLFGGGTNAGERWWSLQNLTVDGNRSNNSPGTDSVNGLACYARKYVIRNVTFQNITEHGMRIEYGGNPDPNSDGSSAAVFENVDVITSGKHGWMHSGPSDSYAHRVYCSHNGKLLDNTYDNFHFKAASGGRFFDLHGWAAALPRTRHALHLETSGGSGDFFGCHFEGAHINVRLNSAATRPMFHGCHFFNAYAGINVLADSPGFFSNCRWATKQAPGRPDVVGIEINTGNLESIGGVFIDQNAGVFDFTGAGDGLHLMGRGFNADAGKVQWIGSPTSLNDLVIYRETGDVSFSIVQLPQLTSLIREGVGTGLAAVGNIQATALALTAGVNVVGTVTPSDDSVKLLSAAPGLSITVVNTDSSNDMRVFPATGDSIDDGAIDAKDPVDIVPGGRKIYKAVDTQRWFSFSTSLFIEDVYTGLAAVGNIQATALALTTGINVVGTVTPSNNSVKLPAAAAGLSITVVNTDAADALQVFPATGDSIDAASIDAKDAVDIVVGGRKIYKAVDTQRWFSFS